MSEKNVMNEAPAESAMGTKEKIEKGFWDAVLLNGKAPASVYALCEAIGVKEIDFYDYYSSLGHIESAYWESTVTETVEVLNQDEDYLAYDFHQKMLAFYYTFFAHIQGNRSRFLERFPLNGITGMRVLSGMRSAFISYNESLIQQGLEEGLVKDRKFLNTYYSKGIFEQFRAIIIFYKSDKSDKFQDTDAFIEKTAMVISDGLRSGLLDSVIDVARFMLRKTPFGQSK